MLIRVTWNKIESFINPDHIVRFQSIVSGYGRIVTLIDTVAGLSFEVDETPAELIREIRESRDSENFHDKVTEPSYPLYGDPH